MERPDQLTVRVLKYDGTEYRRWTARRSRRQGSLLVLDAEFEYDVHHDLLGAIQSGTRTIEYYWLDRWYNVLKFLNDDATTRHFYCNITTPPKLETQTLTYIDLDIDVLALPDFSYQILDLDEFEANAKTYGYPEEVHTNAHIAVDRLRQMIETREFPFLSDQRRTAEPVI